MVFADCDACVEVLTGGSVLSDYGQRFQVTARCVHAIVYGLTRARACVVRWTIVVVNSTVPFSVLLNSVSYLPQ
jgi:hypothetical protein